MTDSDSSGSSFEDRERFVRARAIFLKARELAEGIERERYLDEACASDDGLRKEVIALLATRSATERFLEEDIRGSRRPRPDSLVGSVIGRYRLLELLGEGGFGEVYRVEQIEPMRRELALKVIKPGMDSREVIARFENERQALALMDHPNIAHVHDAGTTESGRPYFVMELARGRSVTEYCDENNLQVRDRLQMFSQICGAVHHAHQKGVIHRDLKPSNIVVVESSDGGKAVPKIIDFGIAKSLQGPLTDRTLISQREILLGTPAYMSPEQLDGIGDDLDTRTDIYALGILLYELLTGMQPFDRERLQRGALAEIRRIIRDEDPPRPSDRVHTLGQTADTVARTRMTAPPTLERLLRGDLDWIVMKAIAKERGLRYQGCNEFAADVDRYLSGLPTEAGPPSTTYRVRKFVRRHKIGVLFTGGLACAVIAGLVFSIAGFASARAQRDRARLAELTAQADALRARTLRSLINPMVLPLEDLNPGFLYFPTDEAGIAADRRLRSELDRLLSRLDDGIKIPTEEEIRIRKVLADSYLSLDLSVDARTQLEHLVGLNRRLHGESDIRYASSLVDYASALDRNFTYVPNFTTGYRIVRATPVAQISEALRLARRAVEIYETNDHVDANAIRALRYLALSGIQAEDELTSRALVDACSSLYGEGALNTLYNRRVLATVLWRAGRVEEGESIWRRSREVFQSYDDNPNVLVPMDSDTFGALLEEAGRGEEAETVYLEEIRRLEGKIRGTFVPEYESCLRRLSRLLVDQGRPNRGVRAKIAAIDFHRVFDPTVCRVEYTVHIATPGRYRLFLRWDGQNHLSDTVSARICELRDGIGGEVADIYGFLVPDFPGDADFATVNDWQTMALFEQSATNLGHTLFSMAHRRHPYGLSRSPYQDLEEPGIRSAEWMIDRPGTYTLQLGELESGAAVDALVLQLANLPRPIGTGPVRSVQLPDGSYRESDGRVVIEAENYTKELPGRVTDWIVQPGGMATKIAYRNFTGSGYIQSLPVRDWIDLAELKRNRAWAAEYEGDSERALALHDEAVALDPGFESWFNRAQALDRMGDYDRAVADYDRALAVAPGVRWYFTFLHRAVSNLRRGRPEDVVADFQWLVEAADGNGGVNVRFLLSRAHASLGEWDKAVACVYPGGGDYLWNVRGDLFAESGDYARARADFVEAAKDTPDGEWQYARLAALSLIDQDDGVYKRLKGDYPVPGLDGSRSTLHFLWLSSMGPVTCPYPEMLVRAADAFRVMPTRAGAPVWEGWNLVGRPDWWNVLPIPNPEQDGAIRRQLAAGGLYRSGHYERAIELLETCVPGETAPFGSYRSRWMCFLAMALHQVGRSDDARAWYARAVATLEEERTTVPQNEDPAFPTPWEHTVTVEALATEAASLIEDGS